MERQNLRHYAHVRGSAIIIQQKKKHPHTSLTNRQQVNSQQWLDDVAALHNDYQELDTWGFQHLKPSIWSFIEYVNPCLPSSDPKRVLRVPIEPLVGLMRHPFTPTPCVPPGKEMANPESRDYLLVNAMVRLVGICSVVHGIVVVVVNIVVVLTVVVQGDSHMASTHSLPECVSSSTRVAHGCLILELRRTRPLLVRAVIVCGPMVLVIWYQCCCINGQRGHDQRIDMPKCTFFFIGVASMSNIIIVSPTCRALLASMSNVAIG